MSGSRPPHKTAATNVVWHPTIIRRAERERLLGQHGRLIWFTGLSGSGKSTIANAVDALLNERGRHTYMLDGDNLRHGLCRDLGFAPDDRTENIRRIAEVGRLFVDAGLIALAAFISPLRTDREFVRSRVDAGDFIEVFVDTPLDVCEQRDPKGLYQRARRGEIADFTGISAPYEPPEHPEVHLRPNDMASVRDAAERVVDALLRFEEDDRRTLLGHRRPE